MTSAENRTIEQIKEHYEIEKELADRLRNATRQERRQLYSSLYDELFQRVPLHPQLTRKSSPEKAKQALVAQMNYVRVLFNVGGKGHYLRLPVYPISCCEKLIEKLPYQLRKSIAKSFIFRLFLGVRMIGRK